MSRVMLTAGNLAGSPYYLQKMERNIYSLEELAYSLVQGAQYLDETIMSPALADWLDQECGLQELAESLRKYTGKSRQLPEYVSLILRAAGYVRQDKLRRVREIVEEGGSLQPLQRSIRNADYLAESRRIYQAIAAYDGILQEYDGMEKNTRAALERKKGLLYSSVFRFLPAAEAFLRAYDLTGDPESYLYYLTVLRLGLPQGEYVSFISEHPEAYEYSLTLEQRVEDAEAAYRDELENGAMHKLSSYYENGQMTGFEVELHRRVTDMKNEYRNMRN